MLSGQAISFVEGQMVSVIYSLLTPHWFTFRLEMS